MNKLGAVQLSLLEDIESNLPESNIETIGELNYLSIEYNGKKYYFLAKRALHAFHILCDLQWHSRTEIECIDDGGKRKYGDPSSAIHALKASGFNIGVTMVTENSQIMRGYRLKNLEQNLDKIKERCTISKKNREFIYKRDNYTCVMCLQKFEAHHLQPDHKIPVLISSDDIDVKSSGWESKLQTTCKLCNGRKREICKKCKNPDCNNCKWSDPKKFGTYIVRISDKSYEIIKNTSPNKPIDEAVDFLISQSSI